MTLSTLGLAIGLIIIVVGFTIGWYYGKWKHELFEWLEVDL